MRIAHVSAEVSPFAKTGGLGDVVGALPIAQAEAGNNVTVWMPYYRAARTWLAKKGIRPEWVTDPIRVDVGFQGYEVGLLKVLLPNSLVPVYMVGVDRFFDREHIYDGDGGRDDGIVRYSVFVRAVLAFMRRLNLVPDVLHAHDWHTTLAPMALRWDEHRSRDFDRTATVLTIHNLAYQGMYGPGAFVHLGLPERSRGGVMWDGVLNLMKGGIQAADAITGVSPNFTREMMSADGGFKLDPMLRSRGDAVSGILNGIDNHVWNPRVDRNIARQYGLESLEGKLENRRALLQSVGMDPDDRNMVVGLVTRMTEQKGIDLLFPVARDLIRDGIRFVFLGSGESWMEEKVQEIARSAPGRFHAHVGFSDEMAHKIEAGVDAFLMPSRFEPCGLSQLYSLAYGTPPIVRRTGGLTDTVFGYSGHNRPYANGFTFDEPSPQALRETVRWAHRCYQDPYLWTQIVQNGMREDHSWARSAGKYLALYQRISRR